MEAGFWHRRWQTNEIPFHEGMANALLVRYFNGLFGGRGRRVFLPLCGKTRDIGWLLAEGHQVVGAELSATAIEQLFAELGVAPERSDLGQLTHYGAPAIDMFVGDIFDLSSSVLGAIDVIYDRAALVALPEEMRRRYAAHLMGLSDLAPQFLITFEYDQSQMDGPPFSVTGDAIRRYYGRRYAIVRTAREDVAGGLKGKCAATEHLWLLQAEAPKADDGSRGVGAGSSVA
jgi:thiopurine S-methyltransferase